MWITQSRPLEWTDRKCQWPAHTRSSSNPFKHTSRYLLFAQLEKRGGCQCRLMLGLYGFGRLNGDSLVRDRGHVSRLSWQFQFTPCQINDLAWPAWSSPQNLTSQPEAQRQNRFN